MSADACWMALLAAVWARWASSSACLTFSAEFLTSVASSLWMVESHTTPLRDYASQNRWDLSSKKVFFSVALLEFQEFKSRGSSWFLPLRSARLTWLCAPPPAAPQLSGCRRHSAAGCSPRHRVLPPSAWSRQSDSATAQALWASAWPELHWLPARCSPGLHRPLETPRQDFFFSILFRKQRIDLHRKLRRRTRKEVPDLLDEAPKFLVALVNPLFGPVGLHQDVVGVKLRLVRLLLGFRHLVKQRKGQRSTTLWDPTRPKLIRPGFKTVARYFQWSCELAS